jgi:3-methyladenine DNA glycosylase/8-oxoguanine DNA glycosylase
MWMQGGETLQAEAVLRVPAAELKACGLSQAKVNYILDLAERFRDQRLTTSGIVGERQSLSWLRNKPPLHLFVAPARFSVS